MYELIMNEKELKQLRAELIFAKKLGLIEDDTLDGVEDRRQKENQKREQMLQKSEIVYGPEQFSLPAYVRYEQTRFRLDFISECEKIKEHYTYSTIFEKEKQMFYEVNRDLFTRYNGDSFTYEEVSGIIKKRMREIEYEKEIHNILCQFS
ncbi:hypothetical protein [Blautia sp.]